MNANKTFRGHQVHTIFNIFMYFHSTDIIVDSNATVRNNTERAFVRFPRGLEPTAAAPGASSLPPGLTSGVPLGQKLGTVLSRTVCTRRSTYALLRNKPPLHLDRSVG